MSTKVAIIGAAGRMGKQITDAVRGAPDMELAQELIDDGTFGHELLLDQGDAVSRITPAISGGNTDVIVEITVPDASFDNIKTLVENGNKRILVGTSGWSAEKIQELEVFLSEYVQRGNSEPTVLIVPNFSISAVLQEKWAVEAAKFFDDVHIIEYHHKAKVDRPSGTALRLADELERVSPSNTRPEISSIRASGYMATQEVIFTNKGERLTINQDVNDRLAFMPGVLLAIRALINDLNTLKPGVNVGLPI